MDNFLDGFVFLWGVIECSGETVSDDREEVFVYFLRVFRVLLVFNVINKKLQVIEEQILVVNGRFEVVLKYFL